MKLDDICTKKTYKTKDGKEKVKWLKVGVLKTTDEGKKFIEINLLPDVPLYVFEQKKEENHDIQMGDLSGGSLDF